MRADPDIVAPLDRWMTAASARVCISAVWERVVPHFCKPGKTDGRIAGIPDSGMRLRIGRRKWVALPAHFLPAEGNSRFWKPVSRILFSGDLGVSIGVDPQRIVTPMDDHVPAMEAFHRRDVVSGQVLRWWGAMVRPLPIRLIVPQLGAPRAGAAVGEFIDWVAQLNCGIDLMSQRGHAAPG